MEEEKKPGVRVMRKSSEDLAAGANSSSRSAMDDAEETYFTTLSTGRDIVLREMMASDLLYMEKTLGNVGDMERSLKLVSRLSTGSGKITFEELQKLKMKDLKKVTELLAKAGGTDDEEGDEDPNF